MTPAKKKTKKVPTKKTTRKVSPAVEALIRALMHRRDDIWAGRNSDLRGDLMALEKKVAKLTDEVDRLEEMATNTSRATASTSKRVSEATLSMSAWKTRADEWSKTFCKEVALAFRVGADQIVRAGAGEGGTSEVELRKQQMEGAVNMIRSGLELWDKTKEEEK